MARQLKRDARGRFASSGTVRNKRPETAATKTTKPTKATKASAAAAGPAKAVAGPKTTTARGRALTRQRELQRQVAAERKATGTVSAKTARSAATLDRARSRYAVTGTGTKRSPTRAGKAADAAKPAAEKPARKPKAKKAATPATSRGGAIVRSPGGAIVPVSKAKPARQATPAAAKPAAAKPAAAKPAKTSKKQVSAAERKYRKARAEMREIGMRAAGRTSIRDLRGRTDSGARNIRAVVQAYQGAARKVRNLEESRGTSSRKKPAAKPAKTATAAAKPKKAVAPATSRGGAIVRSPGGAIVPVSRATPAAKPAAPKKPRKSAKKR
jgi:hypothetical protein